MSRAKIIVGSSALALATPFIVKWEGWRTEPYRDPIGIPTVCSGITGPDVRMGKIYTDEECEHLNNKYVLKYAQVVDRLVIHPLPDKTKAAVISWTYNLGEGSLARSTMLRKFNAGDIRGGCDEMLKWVYAGGRKLQGLVNRRRDERRLCLEGLSDVASR